ncbi:hypothetical protein BS50DRAFT_674708 [Corynespora cassiicola Philippines]|uniref:P-loop containing nucleoside triphosphate hydrolase protein n=1 Tax=Corynespora cassiicola Philippines TaxID=1448308 RepID=A0A2T2NXY5_CORCC|nr:hypothetical protein BS50DRAFT_674708 [Corynespora cassiicola Philippines]
MSGASTMYLFRSWYDLVQAGQFIFGVTLSVPACAHLFRWLQRSDLRQSAHEQGRRYQDEDGEASEESTQMFADRFQRAVFAACAFIGSLSSFARVMSAPRMTESLEEVFQFGIWTALMLQSLALFTEPSAPRRFNVAVLGSINCLNIICALSIGVYLHSIQSQSAQSRDRILVTTELVSAGLACLHGFLLPRRPDVFWKGALVDRRSTSSIFGLVFFSWPWSALRSLSRNPALEIHGLPELDFTTRSLHLFQRFQQQRFMREEDCPLWKLLLFSYSRALFVQLSLTVFGSVISFAPQMMLLGILRVMEKDNGEERNLVTLAAWALGLGISVIATALVEKWTVWLSSMDLGVKMQKQLTMVLFDKMLRSKDSRTATEKTENEDEDMNETGFNIINLAALDTQQVGNCVRDIYRGYEALIKLSITSALIHRLMGWQSLVAGSAVMILLLAANANIARRYARDQSGLMAHMDARMAAVTEAVQGIFQIKISGLEHSWESRILGQRQRELDSLWVVSQWNIAARAICAVTPIIISVLIISMHAYVTGSLKASTAFTCLSILGSIDSTLGALPQLQSGWVGALISLKRLQNHLYTPENHFPSTPDDTIGFDNATVRWHGSGPDGFSLRNLTLSFPPGAISIVEGPTRSGKSLLLAAILGECELVRGNIATPCSSTGLPADIDHAWPMPSAIAYVPQMPWIENATIMKNIIFGSPMQTRRYKKVLQACALEADLAALEHGDQTEIGPKGVNLSGGQRSRVALARALYSRASIVVLDDIFSAVDARTARHIADHVLGGSLTKARTVILASNHLSLCSPYADYIVSLSGEGQYTCALAEDFVRPGLEDAPYSTNDFAPARGHDMSTEAISMHSRKPSSLSVLSFDPAAMQDSDEAAIAPKYVEDEHQRTTGLQHKTLVQYLQNIGGVWFGLFVLVMYMGQVGTLLGQSWWVARWAEQSEENLASTTMSKTDNEASLKWYLGFYVGLATLACFASIMQQYLTYSSTIFAARRLFRRLLHAVLHAPIDFLNRNPLGRILNRFSADTAIVDGQVGQILGGALTGVLQLIAIIGVGISVSWWILPVSVLMLLLCAHSARLFFEAARKLKHLDNVSRSPVFESFCSTMDGLPTIRALLLQERYMNKFAAQVDQNTRALWNLWLVNAWFGCRMALIGSAFVTIATLVIVSMPNITVATTGFALGFLLRYADVVSTFIRSFINLDLALVSTDRVIEYTQITSEKYDGRMPPAAWPEQGHVNVSNLVVRHDPQLPPALNKISFQLLPNERVGVVGRTGAGKSTLAKAFFRMLEAEQGSITLDGIDIASLALQQLRQRLSIIPQDPHLFSGTVRSNLDPFGSHDDTDLMRALESVHWSGCTGGLIEQGTTPSESSAPSNSNTSPTPTNAFFPLDHPILEAGHNLSQGQRQQLSLARAIVDRPKLLILDEATSSMDPATDALVQASIRELSASGFASMLVIAHRINTVLDFDRILVLDRGQVVEWGSPRELLAREGGWFRALADESGDLGGLEEEGGEVVVVREVGFVQEEESGTDMVTGVGIHEAQEVREMGLLHEESGIDVVAGAGVDEAREVREMGFVQEESGLATTIGVHEAHQVEQIEVAGERSTSVVGWEVSVGEGEGDVLDGMAIQSDTLRGDDSMRMTHSSSEVINSGSNRLLRVSSNGYGHREYRYSYSTTHINHESQEDD